MLWRDVATLVKVVKETDDDGYKTPQTETRREVFVDVRSVKRSEFYAAKQAGTEIALVFLVRAADYDGETLVEYRKTETDEPTAYRVVRAYTKAEEVFELNCALEAAPRSVGRKGSMK